MTAATCPLCGSRALPSFLHTECEGAGCPNRARSVPATGPDVGSIDWVLGLPSDTWVRHGTLKGPYRVYTIAISRDYYEKTYPTGWTLLL